MEPTKACTKCRGVKPFSAFSKHRLSKDGHAYQCKECNNKRAKAWRKTPIGIYVNIKGRVNHYKHKPLEITKEDFIKWYTTQERRCVYCDISEDDLWILQEEYDNRVHRLTVDCKDNKTGYVQNNMVLACERCNAIKSNILTHEEMMYVGQNFIKPKWKKVKGGKGE